MDPCDLFTDIYIYYFTKTGLYYCPNASEVTLKDMGEINWN